MRGMEENMLKLGIRKWAGQDVEISETSTEIRRETPIRKQTVRGWSTGRSSGGPGFNAQHPVYNSSFKEIHGNRHARGAHIYMHTGKNTHTHKINKPFFKKESRQTKHCVW